MFKAFFIIFDVCSLHAIRINHPTAVFPSTEKKAGVAAVVVVRLIIGLAQEIRLHSMLDQLPE